MVTVSRTPRFDNWLHDLRDARARARIVVRLDRLAEGNPGDVKAVGSGVSEMRIDYGAGYRVYYTMVGVEAVLLLAGGDKSSQSNDIKAAIELAKNLERKP